MTPQEQTAQLVGMGVGTILAALVAGWVSSDARKRGLSAADALAWAVGVFLMMALFLPIYLWVRYKQEMRGGVVKKVEVGPCPYCGYLNPQGANYCEKCNRQLKSSSEIHTT